MSKRSDKTLLIDIREAVDKILSYTAGLNGESFAGNGMIADAVIRNFEIIGEAASNLSDDFVKQHAEIPFRQMTSMRNRLIHGYFGVNLATLWQVIRDDIPLLKKQLDSCQ